MNRLTVLLLGVVLICVVACSVTTVVIKERLLEPPSVVQPVATKESVVGKVLHSYFLKELRKLLEIN